MSEKPSDPPPLKATVLIALIPRPDRADERLKPAGWLAGVGMGVTALAAVLALGTILWRRGDDLWATGWSFVFSIIRDLIRHGWDGVVVGGLLLGVVISLAALILFIVTMAIMFRGAGHRRVEKLDRDMEIEDQRIIQLAGHPPERLAARSRRLKLEIQFYERGATKFGLATGVSAAVAVLAPVIPSGWKPFIDNFQYYPAALAAGLGLAALVLHHRAEILMHAELLVAEARELALAKASLGGAPPTRA